MSLRLSDHKVLHNITSSLSFFQFCVDFLAFFARILYFKFLELKELNKAIISCALVGYETGYSQLGATRLVGYLPSHTQRALIELLLIIVNFTNNICSLFTLLLCCIIQFDYWLLPFWHCSKVHVIFSSSFWQQIFASALNLAFVEHFIFIFTFTLTIRLKLYSILMKTTLTGLQCKVEHILVPVQA